MSSESNSDSDDRLSMLVAHPFKDGNYLPIINEALSSKPKMETAAETLKAALGSLDQLKWGDYQRILGLVAKSNASTMDPQPGSPKDFWSRVVDDVRGSLAPAALESLDHAIRVCFEQGVPIVTDVQVRPQAKHHTINLLWDEDGKGNPVLRYTIFCLK